MPLLIVILLVCFRLFYFQPFILPRHDTFIAYSTFYYFYNHFYYYHTWPQWMPKVTYGIPSLFFQFFSLSPVSYLVMLVGRLLGATDVMLLFKLTILCEEIIFILGLYALIKGQIQSRWIAAAISVAAITSLESYTNVFFNLRIMYFLPLALNLLWRFVLNRDPKYFWMMALTFTLGAMGNAVYIPIILFYLLAVMGVVLCVGRKIKPSLFWPRDLWTRSVVVATGLLVLLYDLVMFKTAKDLTLLIRDSHAQNPVDVFLTYGGNLNFKELFSGLFWIHDLYSPAGAGYDNTLYVGVIIGIFFIAALIFCREVFFWSIVAGLVFMVLFSFGGWPARLFYFLPGMSLYRHIALVGPLIKLMILIGAAFGFQYLPRQKAGRWIKIALLLALVMEAAVFQNLLKKNYPGVDPFFPDLVKVFTHVRPMLFDVTRLDSPQDVRRLMMTMVQKSGRGCNYVTMFDTFDFDTCHTDVRVDVADSAVLATWIRSQEAGTNYPKIVGCDGHPKVLLLYELPLKPGEDIYKQALPFEAEVTHFDADNAVFKVSSRALGGWFYYADAFHPGWKALVNGIPAQAKRTADGFKALPIDARTHTVEFHFFDATIACLQYLLCFAAIIGLGLLVMFIPMSFPPPIKTFGGKLKRESIFP